MKIFLISLILLGSINVSTAQVINEKYSDLITKAVYSYPYVANNSAFYIDPNLVKAIIYQESRGNPKAKSHAGAYGLTQIMPQTARLLKCEYEKLDDPPVAINCSVKFLAALMEYNEGDLIKTLSGYNGGTWSTEKKSTHKKGKFAGRIYDNPETKKYVVSVLRWYDWFKKSQGKSSSN